MMVIKVTKDVRAGTDRGGEDLFLVFEGKLKDLVPDMADIALGRVPFELDVDSDDFEDESGSLRARSGEYEFEWRGTKDDLRKIVEPALSKEKNWSRNLKGTVCSFNFEHFVDGNAD